MRTAHIGLHFLRRVSAHGRPLRAPDLPPFQGGAAGLFSYDLAAAWSEFRTRAFDEFQFPAMAIGLYDTVLASTTPSTGPGSFRRDFPRRRHRGVCARRGERIEQFQAPAGSDPTRADYAEPSDIPICSHPACRAGPAFAVPGPPGLTSNFSADGYRAAVQRAIDYIHAGDIFQVNLSQRLMFPAASDAASLYITPEAVQSGSLSAWFAFDIGTHNHQRLAGAISRVAEGASRLGRSKERGGGLLGRGGFVRWR